MHLLTNQFQQKLFEGAMHYEVIGKNVLLLTHPCDLPLLFIIPTALSVVHHIHLEQCHR